MAAETARADGVVFVCAPAGAAGRSEATEQAVIATAVAAPISSRVVLIGLAMNDSALRLIRRMRRSRGSRAVRLLGADRAVADGGPG
jgi:hypothetical protein